MNTEFKKALRKTEKTKKKAKTKKYVPPKKVKVEPFSGLRNNQEEVECEVTMTVKKRINKRQAIKDLKILNGMPPYDDAGSFCRGDGYFAKSLVKKYGVPIDQLEKLVGFDEVRDKWHNLRSQMI